jgi:hypothetical protein
VEAEPKFGFRWLLLLWVVIVALWALSGYVLYGDTQRGTFGDMFGAANALFSGLAFATLIYTAWMQREELSLQRKELEATRAELSGQKQQLAEQTKTFRLQRFEDSFFSLLRTQSDIVNAMDIIGADGKITKSRDCFRVWYRRLRVAHSEKGVYPDGQALQATQAIYKTFYDSHQAEIGHYFRHLYHVVKFADEAPIEHKKKYVSLIRAQLSGYEHLLLFYNGLSEYGIQKFKPLIEKYSLLENMPQSKLLMPTLELPLYKAEAYGDDRAA